MPKRPAQENRRRRFQTLYENNYVLMQYAFVEFFVEHIVDVAKTLGGDLHSLIILAVVGQMELRARIREGRLAAGPASRLLPEVPEPASTNASSIAAVTGIPRETVRRKLEGLSRRGWIARDPNGLWKIVVDAEGAASRRDLIDLDRHAMERVARFLAQVDELAQATEPG